MTKVFFGGSRNIVRLNAEVKGRVDKVISSGFAVLIGDANGADKTLQKYLEQLRQGCEINRVDYVLMDTSKPLGSTLTAYLARRLKVRRI